MRPDRSLEHPETTATDAAAPRERAAVSAELQWNLADLYADDAAWRAAKRELTAEIPAVERFAGTLGNSAPTLAAALDAVFGLQRRLGRLASYAAMRADEDTRVGATLAMKQELQQLAADFASRLAWLEPEILALDRATVEAFLAAEPALAIYRHYLDDLLRRQAHTLSAPEERILAEASRMAAGPASVHGLLVDAELPRPEVTLADGTVARLDVAAFARYRAVANRDDRRRVFAAFFGRLHEFRRTLGATLSANVQRDLFVARARRYGSALECALDADAIPVAVYESLVAHVGEHLPTFHRYLGLRRRILGVPQLHYYDLYAPLLPAVELRYSLAEAQRLAVDSAAPLGGEVQAIIERAFAERWLDWLPNEGKRSGAYSNGSAYDVHPYMLLNFDGRYEDVTTLAHELGHTLQSFLSNRAQPYPTAHYPIFVAEVASTFQEALLVDHLLGRLDDDRTRLLLLGQILEGMKGTLFRQTQFAEFELEIHRRAERGEALTGDALDELYLDLARRYYGHADGVCTVDDDVRSEWGFIPHFYYDFYVYQYATSYTASTALVERVLAGDAAATARYLDFLAAGGSDYPIALLRRAGADLESSEPFTLTVRRLEGVMDEVEALLERIDIPG